MNHQSRLNESGKCSRCGKSKPITDLNGYDPFKPGPFQFAKAYCRRLADCESTYAQGLLKELAEKLR